MESSIMELAMSQGIWVVLFVFLFLYTIKNNEKREGNYQSLLESMTNKYDIIVDVKSDISIIKTKILEDETGK